MDQPGSPFLVGQGRWWFGDRGDDLAGDVAGDALLPPRSLMSFGGGFDDDVGRGGIEQVGSRHSSSS